MFTFTRTLGNSLTNPHCTSDSNLYMVMCFVYFLDFFLVGFICNPHATCDDGKCVCIPGYQVDGVNSCTKGCVLHILII